MTGLEVSPTAEKTRGNGLAAGLRLYSNVKC